MWGVVEDVWRWGKLNVARATGGSMLGAPQLWGVMCYELAAFCISYRFGKWALLGIYDQ